MIHLHDVVTGEPQFAFQGHSNQISHIVISPNGKFLASSSRDKTVRLWDVNNGEEVKSFSEELSVITSPAIAFSPDSQTLAISANLSEQVQFWDLQNERWLQPLLLNKVMASTARSSVYAATYEPRQIKYDPTHDILAVTRDDGVHLWDLKTRKQLRVLKGHKYIDSESFTTTERIRGLEFTADGRLLFTGSQDGTIKIREVETGIELRTISVASIGSSGWPSEGLQDIAISPDGQQVASIVGSPGNLSLWDVETGQLIRSYPVDSEYRVALTPDSLRLLSGGTRGITVWDATSAPSQTRFLDQMNLAMDPSFGPLGKNITSQYSHSTFAGKPEIRDLATGAITKRLAIPSYSVEEPKISRDGNEVAIRRRWRDKNSGKVNSDICIVAVESLDVLQTMKESETYFGISFNYNARLLVARKMISGNDPETGKRIRKYVVSVWDVTTGNKLQTFDGLEAVFSPTEDVLAVVDVDKHLQTLDPKSGAVLQVFKGGNGREPAFSGDGRRVVFGNTIWNVKTGQEELRIAGLKENNVGWASPKFDPSGSRLFTFDNISPMKGRLRIWDASSGDLLCAVDTQGSTGFDISPDGWHIVSASKYTGNWIIDVRPLTPERRNELAAKNLVSHLFARPLLKREVIAFLQNANTISEPVRGKALAIARYQESKANLLIVEMEKILPDPNSSPEQFAKALAWAEEAFKLAPHNTDLLSYLGLAYFRNDNFESSIENLQRSYDIEGPKGRGKGELCLIAMSQFKLGKKQDALHTLEQARGIPVSMDFEKLLFEEASNLIGPSKNSESEK